MDFLAVNLLWCLLFLPIALWLCLRSASRRRRILEQWMGPRATDPRYVDLSPTRRAVRNWVFLAAVAFLILAIARPYWGYRLLPFSGRGRDLLVALDVSKSMMSKDICGSSGDSAPERLKHARWLLKELISETPGDRYGIIAFAGRAFLECPLTGDRTSLFAALDEISIDSVPIGGTNIEQALKTAMDAFKAASGGYRAVILVTDGDEVVGDSAKAIAELKQSKIPLLIVGVGDPDRGLIRLPDENGNPRTLLDANGNPVCAKLNEPLLRKLAEETGGLYVRTTTTDAGLGPLKDRISAIIPEKYAEGKATRPLERFHIPLLVGIVLLMAWLAIGERRRLKNGVGKATGTLVALLTAGLLAAGGGAVAQDAESPIVAEPVGPAASPAAVPQRAQAPNAPGPLAADAEPVAAPTSPKAAESKSSDPTLVFNEGVEAQKKGEMEKAEELYARAINLSENKPAIRGRAYQNLGVMTHEKARNLMLQDPEKSLAPLDQAEEYYRDSMRSAPNRPQVAVNQQILIGDREKAKEIIKQRQEAQKKQQEAQQKTQEALDKQQQANQSQGQQKEQQQKEADQKTQEAQKAAQDSQKASEKAGDKQQAQAASEASKDLKNAQDNQQKKDGKQAEKDLEKALEKLGGQPNSQKQSQQKQQQAQQKTQEALEKQQQANQAPKQEQQERQQEADQKTQEAQKAAQDAQKAAEKAGDKKQEQAAGEAAKDLEQARKDQQKKDGQQAEKDLEKALENLKKGQAEKPDKDKKDGQKQDGENKDGKDKDDKAAKPQPKDQKLPQGEPKQAQAARQEEKDIDPNQAARLLDLMAKDEKSLRQELKRRMKENYGIQPVEKDW